MRDRDLLTARELHVRDRIALRRRTQVLRVEQDEPAPATTVVHVTCIPEREALQASPEPPEEGNADEFGAPELRIPSCHPIE